MGDDVTARVAVLESTVTEAKAKAKEDHEELKELRIAVETINGKLDNINDKLDAMAKKDPESRIRSLEDWRTGLVAKMSVIAVVAAFAASILTVYITKWINEPTPPSPRVANHCAPGAPYPCEPSH